MKSENNFSGPQVSIVRSPRKEIMELAKKLVLNANEASEKNLSPAQAIYETLLDEFLVTHHGVAVDQLELLMRERQDEGFIVKEICETIAKSIAAQPNGAIRLSVETNDKSLPTVFKGYIVHLRPQVVAESRPLKISDEEKTEPPTL